MLETYATITNRLPKNASPSTPFSSQFSHSTPTWPNHNHPIKLRNSQINIHTQNSTLQFTNTDQFQLIGTLNLNGSKINRSKTLRKPRRARYLVDVGLKRRWEKRCSHGGERRFSSKFTKIKQNEESDLTDDFSVSAFHFGFWLSSSIFFSILCYLVLRITVINSDRSREDTLMSP